MVEEEPDLSDLYVLLGRDLAQMRDIPLQYSDGPPVRFRTWEPRVDYAPGSPPIYVGPSLAKAARRHAALYTPNFRRKLERLGKSYIELLDDPLYQIFCGDKADRRLLKYVQSFATASATAVAVTIASHIKTELGIRDELTLVIAWVIVRSFLIGAHGNMCKNWTEARDQRHHTPTPKEAAKQTHEAKAATKTTREPASKSRKANRK